MTIDEAITLLKFNNKHIADLKNDDLQQIAEWLELLKWYQQGMEDIPSKSGVLPKDVYHAGYEKAIDDFAEKVKEMYAFTILEEVQLEKIAEQLKAGGENEN